MFEYNAEVTKVIDGDTVDVTVDLGFKVFTTTRVRLHGINTPESRTRDKEEKVRGLAAKEYLKGLLELNDNKVKLQSLGLGKFGRCLGILKVSKLLKDSQENIKVAEADDHQKDWYNINQQLIIDGHAVEYFGGKR